MNKAERNPNTRSKYIRARDIIIEKKKEKKRNRRMKKPFI